MGSLSMHGGGLLGTLTRVGTEIAPNGLKSGCRSRANDGAMCWAQISLKSALCILYSYGAKVLATLA